MRRTWLRRRENIHKRYLIHVAGHNLGLLMRLLVGAGTPKEAVARGWGFFLAQSPGDGASNTAILLFWTTSASDPHAIACIILRTRSGVAGLCHPFCGACRFPRPRCFCFRFLPLRRGGALTGR